MNSNKNNFSVALLLISAITLMITMVFTIFSEPNGVFDDYKDYESMLIILFILLLLLSLLFYSISVLKRIKPKKYIYISYANIDNDIVVKIIDELDESLSKLSKFRFDILTHQDVPLGEDFFESIKANINKSEIFIIVVSQSYLNKSSCLEEFERIFQKNNNTKIIPIVLDSFDDLAKLPKDLSKIKALPLFYGMYEKDFSKQIKVLAEDLIKYKRN